MPASVFIDIHKGGTSVAVSGETHAVTAEISGLKSARDTGIRSPVSGTQTTKRGF